MKFSVKKGRLDCAKRNGMKLVADLKVIMDNCIENAAPVKKQNGNNITISFKTIR